jgi:hypothetical protein
MFTHTNTFSLFLGVFLSLTNYHLSRQKWAVQCPGIFRRQTQTLAISYGRKTKVPSRVCRPVKAHTTLTHTHTLTHSHTHTHTLTHNLVQSITISLIIVQTHGMQDFTSCALASTVASGLWFEFASTATPFSAFQPHQQEYLPHRAHCNGR